MMLGFNAAPPLLNQASEAWLFDVFQWLHTYFPVQRPANMTTRHLQNNLRPFYKKAHKALSRIQQPAGRTATALFAKPKQRTMM